VNSLSQQRCANHGGREAVAKCISCNRFFCRECVTEHGERMLCSACLAQSAVRSAGSNQRSRNVTLGALGLAGLVLAWTLFYFAGDLIATVSAPAPSEQR